MADALKFKPTKLTRKLSEYVTASEAVREGIATHAEKHRAMMHEQRKQLAAARKLQGGK